MITLITGAPGNGKTVYAVWYAAREALAQGRAVYVSGIPELTLPVTVLTDEEVRNWPETVPDGALIIIDEVQRVWRPTGPTASVAKDIAALETHRHRGLDFVILTQHPSLVHRNVRALVGKHLHIRATWSGRSLFEFPEWCESPQNRSARLLATKRAYKLPPAAFKLYKSASIHVKPTRRVPVQVFVVLAALVAVPVAGYMAYASVDRRIHPADTKPGSQVTVLAQASAPQTAAKPQVLPPDPPVQSLASLQIVTPSIPWDKVGGCMVMGDRCTCYGDEAQRLSIDDATCRIAIESGWGGRKETAAPLLAASPIQPAPPPPAAPKT